MKINLTYKALFKSVNSEIMGRQTKLQHPNHSNNFTILVQSTLDHKMSSKCVQQRECVETNEEWTTSWSCNNFMVFAQSTSDSANRRVADTRTGCLITTWNCTACCLPSMCFRIPYGSFRLSDISKLSVTGWRDSVTLEITSTTTGLEAPRHDNPGLWLPAGNVEIGLLKLILTPWEELSCKHRLHLDDFPHVLGHYKIVNSVMAQQDACISYCFGFDVLTGVKMKSNIFGDKNAVQSGSSTMFLRNILIPSSRMKSKPWKWSPFDSMLLRFHKWICTGPHIVTSHKILLFMVILLFPFLIFFCQYIIL
jgi:hypothetical protein